jgi:VanZ family protein
MPSANGRCDGPRFLRDWLPVIVLFAATFVASSIPGERLPPLGAWNADKLIHGLEYAIAGALLVRPLGRTAWGSRRTALALLAAVALASAWGAFDELHQLITPNRACDWGDWIADTAGALVGALVWLAVTRARARRRLAAAPAHGGQGAP